MRHWLCIMREVSDCMVGDRSQDNSTDAVKPGEAIARA
jgi:hypothetical protein